MPIQTSFANPDALSEAIANFDFGEPVPPQEFNERIIRAREATRPLTRAQIQRTMEEEIRRRARELGIDVGDPDVTRGIGR